MAGLVVRRPLQRPAGTHADVRSPPDASAAPFRDWNARVTEECYRPNAALGTLRYASWDLGPTLTAYLADAAPEVLAGFADGDRLGGGTGGGPGLAQPFHHSILPLLPAHDRRTEILWGLRDFEQNYYAAFVLDPDGNNIEAVTRQ